MGGPGPQPQAPAWLTSLRWPRALRYTNLDPATTYVLRLTVTGDVRPRLDGVPADVVDPGAFVPMLREVAVPASAVADGEVIVTFDDIDESDRNWRQYSRLHEAFLRGSEDQRTRGSED